VRTQQQQLLPIKLAIFLALLPIKLAIFLALLMGPLTATVLARLRAAGTATTVSLGLSTRPSFCETASTWRIICLTTGVWAKTTPPSKKGHDGNVRAKEQSTPRMQPHCKLPSATRT
jgi:hypothetical protein